MLTLYYDDTCILCTTNAEHVQEKNPNMINIVSVDDGLEDLHKANISCEYAMTYVCVKDDSTGQILSGMPAIRLLYDTAQVKAAPILHLPVIKQITHITYPFFARNRYYFPKWLIRLLYGKVASMQACKDGVCSIPPKKR